MEDPTILDPIPSGLQAFEPEDRHYYSPGAIWGFSILVTVLFGAVLLASNLTDRRAKGWVLGFGIAYTVVALLILISLPLVTNLALPVNAGGAAVLAPVLWNKYIGKNVKFTPKPVWKPLIVAILIVALFLAAFILGS